MTAPDSSVLVAGYLSNHEFHREAAAGLATVARTGCLLAHIMAETYAVLTAPGGPYEAPAESVLRYLEHFLDREPVWLPAPQYAEALGELARTGIEGGALYDGLIALAARNAGARLISLDRRATRTYEHAGVTYELLA